jgi:hypothetical protein
MCGCWGSDWLCLDRCIKYLRFFDVGVYCEVLGWLFGCSLFKGVEVFMIQAVTMRRMVFLPVWMVCFFFLVSANAQKDEEMAMLRVLLDGTEVGLSATLRGDEVYVALDDFCKQIDAEAKVLEAGGALAVCREDLCIPLNVSDTEDTLTVAGVLFGRLTAFADPLGLVWTLNNGALEVTSGQVVSGLGIGNVPPPFTLPDLYSGAPVSVSDYRGKKTVFYMWASW